MEVEFHISVYGARSVVDEVADFIASRNVGYRDGKRVADDPTYLKIEMSMDNDWLQVDSPLPSRADEPCPTRDDFEGVIPFSWCASKPPADAVRCSFGGVGRPFAFACEISEKFPVWVRIRASDIWSAVDAGHFLVERFGDTEKCVYDFFDNFDNRGSNDEGPGERIITWNVRDGVALDPPEVEIDGGPVAFSPYLDEILAAESGVA